LDLAHRQTIECTECQERFSTKNKLHKHLREVHGASEKRSADVLVEGRANQAAFLYIHRHRKHTRSNNTTHRQIPTTQTEEIKNPPACNAEQQILQELQKINQRMKAFED